MLCYTFVHYFTNPSKILRLDVFFMLYSQNKNLCRRLGELGPPEEKQLGEGGRELQGVLWLETSLSPLSILTALPDAC